MVMLRSSRFFGLIEVFSIRVKYAHLPVCRFRVVRIPSVEGKVQDMRVVRASITTSNAAVVGNLVPKRLTCKNKAEEG